MSMHQTFTDVLLAQHAALDWKLSTERTRPTASMGSYNVCVCLTLCYWVLPLMISWVNWFIFSCLVMKKNLNYEFVSNYSFDNKLCSYMFLAIAFSNNWLEPLFDLRVYRRLLCMNLCFISNGWRYFALSLLISGLFYIRAKEYIHYDSAF